MAIGYTRLYADAVAWLGVALDGVTMDHLEDGIEAAADGLDTHEAAGNPHSITPAGIGASPTSHSHAGGDADTLDGLDSLQFARSDADDTLTGIITLDHTADATARKHLILDRGAADKWSIGTSTTYDLLIRDEVNNEDRLAIGADGTVKADDGLSGLVEMFPRGTLLDTGSIDETDPSYTAPGGAWANVLDETVTLDYSAQPVIVTVECYLLCTLPESATMDLRPRIDGTNGRVMGATGVNVWDVGHGHGDGFYLTGSHGHSHQAYPIGTTTVLSHSHSGTGSTASTTPSGLGIGGGVSTGYGNISTSVDRRSIAAGFVREFTPAGATISLAVQAVTGGSPSSVGAAFKWRVERA